MAPTKDEERRLKEHKDDSLYQLGPAERFLKAVLDIPSAFKRVDAMLYIANFESDVQYLRRSFDILEVNQSPLFAVFSLIYVCVGFLEVVSHHLKIAGKIPKCRDLATKDRTFIDSYLLLIWLIQTSYLQYSPNLTLRLTFKYSNSFCLVVEVKQSCYIVAIRRLLASL